MRRLRSLDRRENLLEDHSVLDRTLTGCRTTEDLFGYYLDRLTDPSITTHFQPVGDATVPFARRWGMSDGLRDLGLPRPRGRARPRGLVLIDGGTFGPPLTRADARKGLAPSLGSPAQERVPQDGRAVPPSATLIRRWPNESPACRAASACSRRAR